MPHVFDGGGLVRAPQVSTLTVAGLNEYVVMRRHIKDIPVTGQKLGSVLNEPWRGFPSEHASTSRLRKLLADPFRFKAAAPKLRARALSLDVGRHLRRLMKLECGAYMFDLPEITSVHIGQHALEVEDGKLSPPQVAQLWSEARPAAFGDLVTGATRVDPEVRAAREIAVSVDPVGVLPRAQQQQQGKPKEVHSTASQHLLTAVARAFGRRVELLPYKLTMYGVGGHFKPHVDTPVHPRMLGSSSWASQFMVGTRAAP